MFAGRCATEAVVLRGVFRRNDELDNCCPRAGAGAL